MGRGKKSREERDSEECSWVFRVRLQRGGRSGPVYVTEVVSGAAPGVDTLGELWADKNNISVKQFPAEWSRYGRKAGPMRNQQMAEYARRSRRYGTARAAGPRT